MRVLPGQLSEVHVVSGPRESVELFLWVSPLLIAWVLVGAWLSRRLASFLQVKRWHAFLLFVSVGFILAATLTPTSLVLEAYGVSSGQCDLSRQGLLPLPELLNDYDAVVNIVLFGVLGFLLGLLPRTRRNLLITTAAFGLTLLIEATQMLLPQLGRGCESADMIDNTLGLVIGLLAGVIAAALLARRHPKGDAEPS